MPEPFEIRQLKARLRADFTGRLPEAERGTPDERELNFLSRALAAYAVHNLSGCAPDEAATAVVDGGGDGGIDAVFHAPDSQTLFVVQSKFMANGRGEPGLQSVSEYFSGVRDLLAGRFAAFEKNPAWRAVTPRLKAILDDLVQVRLILVYSGVEIVSDDRRERFAQLQDGYEGGRDFLQFETYGLTTVHDWVTGADEVAGVERIEITLLRPAVVAEPFEMVYGLARVADLVRLYRDHGDALVAANIREYKGSTEVNQSIAATLRERPEHFVYVNNGLTAYCTRLQILNTYRGNLEEKRMRVSGLSVVNGAQTLGTLAAHYADPAHAPSEAFVFVKLISLEHCLDEEEFARTLTQSTNRQNHIGQADFVALDPEQRRIAVQLRLAGVRYRYKSGVGAAQADERSFGVREAALALASLEWERSGDLCATVLRDPDALLSMEVVYPEGDRIRTRYHRLFRPERSPRDVWRAVQARRAVLARLQGADAGAEPGRGDFNDHAGALVLNLVLLKRQVEQGDAPALTEGELDDVARSTDQFADALWRAYAGLCVPQADGAGVDARSVFSDGGQCRWLRGTVLREFAGAGSVEPAPAE
jgi:AIPR protein